MVRLKPVAAVLWMALCVAVLVVTLSTPTSPETGEAGVFLVLAMLILSFPIGGLLLAVVALMSPLLAPDVMRALNTSVLGITIGWCGFVASGYFQWFVLLPHVVRRLRQWRIAGISNIVSRDGRV